jgi:hypothetical protein
MQDKPDPQDNLGPPRGDTRDAVRHHHRFGGVFINKSKNSVANSLLADRSVRKT